MKKFLSIPLLAALLITLNITLTSTYANPTIVVDETYILFSEDAVVYKTDLHGHYKQLVINLSDEYDSIYDMITDDINELIYIFTDKHTVIGVSYSGSFLWETTLTEPYKDVVSLDSENQILIIQQGGDDHGLGSITNFKEIHSNGETNQLLPDNFSTKIRNGFFYHNERHYILTENSIIEYDYSLGDQEEILLEDFDATNFFSSTDKLIINDENFIVILNSMTISGFYIFNLEGQLIEFISTPDSAIKPFNSNYITDSISTFYAPEIITLYDDSFVEINTLETDSSLNKINMKTNELSEHILLYSDENNIIEIYDTNLESVSSHLNTANITAITFMNSIAYDLKPVIEIIGDESITLELDSEYEELGATAIDERGTSYEVEVTGSVDSSKVGTYLITYNAQNDFENRATSKTRIVSVVDLSAPIFEGPSIIIKNTDFITQGNFFLHFFEAFDVNGEDISENIDIIDNQYRGNANEPGEYEVTLEVHAENETSTIYTFTIIVKDDMIPLLILDDDHFIVSNEILIDQEGFIETLKTTGILDNETFLLTDIEDTYTEDFEELGLYTKIFELNSESGQDYFMNLIIEVIENNGTTYQASPGFIQNTIGFLTTWWLGILLFAIVIIGIKKR